LGVILFARAKFIQIQADGFPQGLSAVNSGTQAIKLGDLLISANLLTAAQLAAAIETARQSSLPVGKVLTINELLTDVTLQAAIKAQSLIKDNQLSIDAAVAALKLTAAKALSLDAALETLEQARSGDGRTVRLGEILITAGFLDKAQLDQALRDGKETALPLGRILVLGRTLSEELVSAALTAQVLLRDGRISFDQAIAGLKASRQRRIAVETALAEEGYIRPTSKQKIKIGELFVLAELIAENSLMGCVEKSLIEQKPIGQAFLETGLTTAEVLEAALKLQEMVTNGALSGLQAARALRQVALQRYPLKQALSEVDSLRNDANDPYRLSSILTAAQLVSEDDLKSAVELSTLNSALFGRMIQAAGIIDEEVLNAALRAQFFLRESTITLEQAIIGLNQCRQTGQSFDQVAEQLGWNIKKRIRT
jgi:hypothetical protein